MFLKCPFLMLLGIASPVIALADEQAAISRFETQIQRGDFAGAQEPLELFVKENSKSWRAQYQLGYVYFRLHRLQQSVENLCKSLLLNEGFADSHKILAFDLNMLGRPELAKRELTRAIALDPKSAESQYELGRILYEEGAYGPAIEHLEAARQLDSAAIRVYHNLGLAYGAIDEHGKAIENFEEGLRRNAAGSKPSAWPLIDYASYLNRRNQFQRARELLKQAITIDVTRGQAFDELARACRGLGLKEEAIAALQHATATSDSKPEYHYELAQLYRQTGRAAQAKDELDSYEKSQAAPRRR